MKSSKDNSKLSICALVLCAGTGTRVGLGYNKVLHYVGKKTILEMTLDRVFASNVQSVMLVISRQDQKAIEEITKAYKNLSICFGGETRSESVRRGLNEIGHCDIVVIHDGARPYVSIEVINRSIESAATYGSGVVSVPTVDTIKEIKNNDVVRTLSRSGLFNIQTPQTFIYDQITDAYNKVSGIFTDDSEVFERAGYIPKIVVGEYDNIKVTTMRDLYNVPTQKVKIGVGFDVHKLVYKRNLILGGVHIPHDKGLKGHSDADVVVHAIMDALLSAAGLPDIGVLFPDNDPNFKDISSLVMLAMVRQTITSRGFVVGNISSVIMAEKPKMASYIPQMCANIALVLGITPAQINISATTTEQLGIIGEEKGIASSATCMMFYP